jgi:transmembrane sensor
MTSAAPTTSRRKSRAEASAWVVQLHAPERSPALEAAFRDWLSADPEHRVEFERVTRVWVEASGVRLAGITRLETWGSPRTAWRWAIGASTLFICGIGIFVAYLMWFAGVYKTDVGEQRIVRLEDGTRVSLNSSTKIVVRLSNMQRHVTLARGEAYFEVAHNRQRPFIVTAGDHDVTAVGTAFMVRFDSGNTAVTLLEGKVTVSHAEVEKTVATGGIVVPAGPGSDSHVTANVGQTHAPGRSTRTDIGTAPPVSPDAPHAVDTHAVDEIVTLIPGERLLLAGDAATLDQPHMDVVTAWRRGEVVLEHTPLNEAIAEMNRYEQRKLIISSPEIAHLRISGIYHVGDAAGFADTIATLYHLRVENTEAGISIAAPTRPGFTPQARP